MRRFAALVLLLGVFVTLALAACHNHLDSSSSQADGCVYCSGAIATAPPVPSTEPPPVFAQEAAWILPAAPAPRFLLQLDHSGCAPPLA